MKHYFVDANIIIDFLSGREPFATDAALLFSLGEEGRIKLYASAVSFNVVYYVLRQKFGHATTLRHLGELCSLVSVTAVTEEVIKNALSSGNNDFEDAIQYYSAIGNPEIEAIISRDRSGFKKSRLSVFTAAEALQLAQ